MAVARQDRAVFKQSCLVFTPTYKNLVRRSARPRPSFSLSQPAETIGRTSQRQSISICFVICRKAETGSAGLCIVGGQFCLKVR